MVLVGLPFAFSADPQCQVLNEGGTVLAVGALLADLAAAAGEHGFEGHRYGSCWLVEWSSCSWRSRRADQVCVRTIAGENPRSAATCE